MPRFGSKKRYVLFLKRRKPFLPSAFRIPQIQMTLVDLGYISRGTAAARGSESGNTRKDGRSEAAYSHVKPPHCFLFNFSFLGQHPVSSGLDSANGKAVEDVVGLQISVGISINSTEKSAFSMRYIIISTRTSFRRDMKLHTPQYTCQGVNPRVITSFDSRTGHPNALPSTPISNLASEQPIHYGWR